MSSQARKRLDRSHAAFKWIAENWPLSIEFGLALDDPEAEARRERGKLKTTTAATLFAISFGHYNAILLLLDHGARSSAFALARSVLDATARGAWLAYTATEDEVAQFRAGKLRLKSDDPIDWLQRVPELEALQQLLATMKSQAYALLCDYSHSGAEQLDRWFLNDEIGEQHGDAETATMLDFVDMLAFVSLGCLTADGKQDALLQAMKSHFDWKD